MAWPLRKDNLFFERTKFQQKFGHKAKICGSGFELPRSDKKNKTRTKRSRSRILSSGPDPDLGSGS